MKKNILIYIAFFVFGTFLFNQVFSLPLTPYSELIELDNETSQFIFHSEPKFYYNEQNNLVDINSHFEVLSNSDFNYQVKKGFFTLKAKNNGLIRFEYKEDSLEFKLVGIGFFNRRTKEYFVKTGLNFSKPEIKDNKLIWSLPFDSNYILQYNNGNFKDVLTLSQQIKEYFKNNIPNTWDRNDSFIALIYFFDLNSNSRVEIEGQDANSSDLETEETISFIKNGRKIYSLNQSHVWNTDLNHFDENNAKFNLWNKRKKILNKLFIEAIPVNSLFSANGNLIWNATLTVNVSDQNDDADETNGGVMTVNGTTLRLYKLFWGIGIIFREITIPQGTTISEARLRLTGGYACTGTGGCRNRFYGIAEDDTNTFGNTDIPSIQTKTSANKDLNQSGSFVQNLLYATWDLNVTAIVQEILNRSNWSSDNNLGFVAQVISTCTILQTCNLAISSFESEYPKPELTITFPSQACFPNADKNWIINQNCFLKNKKLNLGKASIIVDRNGSLTLLNTDLNFNGQFLCMKTEKEIDTLNYDGNDFTAGNPNDFSPDESCIRSRNLSYNKQQSNHDFNYFYFRLTFSVSINNILTLWFPATKFIENASFPLIYSVNGISMCGETQQDNVFPSDINIQITNDGNNWDNVYEKTSFNLSQCDANILVQSGSINIYYCDINVSVRQLAKGIRFIGTMIGSQLKLNSFLINARSVSDANLLMTYDANMSSSNEWDTNTLDDYATHPANNEGVNDWNVHTGLYWMGGSVTPPNEAWIQINFDKNFYIRKVEIPINYNLVYPFNLDVNYYHGGNWIRRNAKVRYGDNQTEPPSNDVCSSFEKHIVDGNYYCNVELFVNKITDKIRILAPQSNMQQGFLANHSALGKMAFNNIRIQYENPFILRRPYCLSMRNSNIFPKK